MGAAGQRQIVVHFDRVVRLEGRSGIKQAAKATEAETGHVIREKLAHARTQLKDVASRQPRRCDQVLKVDRVVLDGEIAASVAGDANAVDRARSEQIGVAKGEILDAVRGAIDRRDEKAALTGGRVGIPRLLAPIRNEESAEEGVLVAHVIVDTSQPLIFVKIKRGLVVIGATRAGHWSNREMAFKSHNDRAEVGRVGLVNTIAGSGPVRGTELLGC